MPSSTPDVAQKTKSLIPLALERVGMEDIEVPLYLELGNQPPVMQMGRADAYVNLVKPEAKGIHMSRLFIKLQEILSDKTFSPGLAKKILSGFLVSHEGLSDKAYLNLSYEHPKKQKSLTSEKKSWRSYPVAYKFTLDASGKFACELTLSVVYSSTCPCSAALSRQALQEKFKESFEVKAKGEKLDFSEISDWLSEEKNMAATPHSQRSKATLILNIKEDSQIEISDLIDLADTSLATSVQSIVKREDEKEFAKLNASNLMFAEDAARRLKKSLSSLSELSSFSIKVCHYESLHAHNAVAYAKG